MFYFIETITHGKNAINWERLINNNINLQLRRLMHTRTFYMSSYVIYSIARNYEYPGLMYRGIVGRRPGQIKVYDCYSQLKHLPKQHYKRVNDAFTISKNTLRWIAMKALSRSTSIGRTTWCMVHPVPEIHIYQSSRMSFSSLHVATLTNE